MRRNHERRCSHDQREIATTTPRVFATERYPDAPPAPDCDGPTIVFNGCAWRLWRQRDVELRIAVGVMGHYEGFADELTRLQVAWEADRAARCDRIHRGGSGYTAFHAGCMELAAQHRIDELYAIDISTDAPRPEKLWGTNVRAAGACVERIRATVAAADGASGTTVLADVAELTMDLDDDFVGQARGTTTLRVVLRDEDGRSSTHRITVRSMGERVVDTIAGIYEGGADVAGPGWSGRGYWYLRLDGERVQGELVDLDDRMPATITGLRRNPCD